MTSDWRKWITKFRYTGITDPKYIKDRDEFFIKNGNGWWWEWNRLNTPIPGIFSPKDDKRSGGDRGPKKVDVPPKEDFL